MNIHTQLKTLTLLCTIPLFNAFAAQPALPESLRIELASIDALSDHEILCKVMCRPQENAEQILTKIKQKLKEDAFLDSSFAQKDVHTRRLAHKLWAIEHELEACDNPAIKAVLQAQKKRIDSEGEAANKELQILLNSLNVNGRMPLYAYGYLVKKLNVLGPQASLLLAQKTKLENTLHQKEAQWQIKESQWQQREQALLAQLRHYQLLVDGEQVDASGVASQVENSVLSKNTRHGLAEREGMPNVPGGVK